MKVCVPVAEFCGLESRLYGHFGSAPFFALVDTKMMSVESLTNRDHGHVHGACSPLKALAGAKPDAVVVGGIGQGALLGLRDMGIKVYYSPGSSVEQIAQQIEKGALEEVRENGVCTGHGADCHR